MAGVKMTFSLDAETAKRLEQTSERLRRPKSQVVREAIRDYSLRVNRLSEAERLEMLDVFDRVVAEIPRRSAAQVDRELHEIREARRSGGRKSLAGRS